MMMQIRIGRIIIAAVAAEVFANLTTINRSGVSIVLVEQNVKAALSIAARGIILVEGKLRHEGKAAELLRDPVIAALYLGTRQMEPKAS